MHVISLHQTSLRPDRSFEENVERSTGAVVCGSSRISLIVDYLEMEYLFSGPASHAAALRLIEGRRVPVADDRVIHLAFCLALAASVIGLTLAVLIR